MLARFLLEVNRLVKDESSSLVFNFKLCVGSSGGEVVLVVKAIPPQGRIGGQDSVSDFFAD